jgi:hypothetical protein
MRVTLTGSEAFSQRHNSYPSRITVPRLPQIFELVGRNRHGEEVIKYGFVLQKWFVTRAHGTESRRLQEAWCNGLGYRLSRVKDLTNAVCVERNGLRCKPGLSAAPSSNRDIVDRRIGAGMIGEWGDAI